MSPGADRGSVTAELAVVLPGVVLMVAALLVVLAAAGVQLRADEAARAGARLAAFGAGEAEVKEAVARVLPGATVQVVGDPPWVEVRVSASVAGGWLTAGPLTAHASAVAWVEP